MPHNVSERYTLFPTFALLWIWKFKAAEGGVRFMTCASFLFVQGNGKPYPYEFLLDINNPVFV